MEEAIHKAAKLADLEQEQTKKHREKIARVVLEIETILIREDFTVSDFDEVLQSFNQRNIRVIPKLKIKEIKKIYENG